MPQKQDYLQSELFSQEEGQNFKIAVARKPFLFRIRGHEKALLLVMGFVLTAIVAFSLGVEKGKNIPLFNGKLAGLNSYTIQVAAFQNKNLALKHAQFLTGNNLSPLIFTKGRFIILCVGKFYNEESAQPLMLQLQKNYPNCRIRRL